MDVLTMDELVVGGADALMIGGTDAPEAGGPAGTIAKVGPLPKSGGDSGGLKRGVTSSYGGVG
jgi:hypothetical protein